MVVVAVIISQFWLISRHYREVTAALEITPTQATLTATQNHTTVVLVNKVHRGVISALQYAKALRPNHLVAVTVVHETHEADLLINDWERFGIDIPLEVVYSPYRELVTPIEEYLDELDERWNQSTVTVILPEFVVSWWETPLHNQSALALKLALRDRANTVVTSVPYDVGSREDPGP